MSTSAIPKTSSTGRGSALVHQWRADFPILNKEIQGRPLVYLDNAATTQRPQCVIDSVTRFYERENANIHRGVYYLSLNATDAYDRARRKVAEALNARDSNEIVFVRGATEAINLVASSYGQFAKIGEGDNILITVMEHHANIVPWQLLAEKTGANVIAAPVTDSGELVVEEFEKLLDGPVKIAAFTHVSNSLGTVNPVREMCRLARDRGVCTLVDGAQATGHGSVDVQDIDCDFYVYSGHKVFGPDGIGVLYGRGELLKAMPPYQGGGGMIERVTIEKSTYRNAPEKFEAGTPNISGAIGLGAALDYVGRLDWDEVRRHETELLTMATELVESIPGLRIIGTAKEKISILSFVVDGVHPHDIGTILDTEGVAVRAGHHCTQPLMHRMGVTGTARASFAFYNTFEEIEKLVESIRKAQRLFGE